MSQVIHKTTLEIRSGVDAAGYDPATWFIDPDLSSLAGVPEKYWKLSGGAIVEMSQAEKDTQDAAILSSTKSAATAKLSEAVKDYIQSHYQQHRQTTFSFLLIAAMAQGYTNRMNYIMSGFAWVSQIIGYYYVKEAEIAVQTTLEGAAGVIWDLAQFDASDPAVTIAGANAITN